MDAVGIRAGMTIGEVGAGRGYFTFKLSRRVGTEGGSRATQSHTASLAGDYRVFSDVLAQHGIVEARSEFELTCFCESLSHYPRGIDGNVGMLGEDYAGYFPWGDANELARLLAACRDAQGEPDGLLARLDAQARARARLFAPEAERAAVQQLVDGLAA